MGRCGRAATSRLIDVQIYLDQVVAYVHLNPVRAGLVSDPGRYRWSGHREIVRRGAAAEDW